MRKLFNRLVCVFVFITDIPVLLLITMWVTINMALALLWPTASVSEYLDLIVDTGAIDRFKRLYAKLWRSFRDGELYS